MILKTKRRRVADVEAVGEVGGAGERQGMALHPGQHLVGLTDLPVPRGVAPVGQQGVGFVEDQERLAVARFPERRGDLLLGFPDPGRHEIGCPLLHDLQPEPVGEIADAGALPRARRPVQAEREAPFAAVGQPAGKPHEVGVRPHEREIETPRHALDGSFAAERAGEPPQAAPHGIDIAAGEARGGGHLRRDAGRCLESGGERERVPGSGLDVVAGELARPESAP